MAKTKVVANPIIIPVVVIHEQDAKYCTVVPGPARVYVGDHVRWFNNTSASITVTFPHSNLGTAKGFQVQILKGKWHTSNPAATKGACSYQIFCEATGNNAVGSDPEIIIV